MNCSHHTNSTALMLLERKKSSLHSGKKEQGTAAPGLGTGILCFVISLDVATKKSDLS